MTTRCARRLDVAYIGWAVVFSLSSCSKSNIEAQGPDASKPVSSITECVEVIPDVQYQCPGAGLVVGKHTVTYVDMSVDNVMAANPSAPDQAGDVIISTGKLYSQFSWATSVSTASPNLQYITSARMKQNCSALSCSFGRITLWLDSWDPTTNTWTLTNMAPVYGLNSEAHGWSTWLHGTAALFNALVWPTSTGWVVSQSDNAAQIYNLTIDSGGKVTLAEFAPAKLHDPNCLTGRVSAMPNLAENACFDGQRIAFERRCYQGEAVTAFWNNTQYDGSGGACLPNAPSDMQVPILRVYVAELDANCVPKKSWASGGLLPVHEPATDNIYRQIGNTPEWGEMIPAISPDGNYVGVSTLMGPSSNADSCTGFRYGLQDVNDQHSGGQIRILHWCPLERDNATGQITCSHPMTALNPGGFNPPEATTIPTFYSSGGAMTVLFSRYWAQYQQGPVMNIMQNDLGTSYHLLTFGTDGSNMLWVQAIYR